VERVTFEFVVHVEVTALCNCLIRKLLLDLFKILAVLLKRLNVNVLFLLGPYLLESSALVWACDLTRAAFSSCSKPARKFEVFILCVILLLIPLAILLLNLVI
jgi:hypothetical protein